MASWFSTFSWLVLYIWILCVFVSSQQTEGTACLEIKPCYCLGNRVNCEGKHLTAIPVGIPSDITALNLGYNNIVDLDPKQLLKFTALKELHLHHNNIRSIPPWDSFPSTLMTLTLHHNKIVAIPSLNTTKQHALKNLYLNSNKISSIGHHAFTNLSNLQNLKLGKNRLTSVPSDALSQLQSLKRLDLSRNFFTSILASAFNRLSSLEVLKLSKNRISTIRGAFWGQNKLQQLYLDRNNFTTIQTSSFFGLRDLQNLYLQSNRISTIITTKFADWRSFPVLRKLNLERNRLSHIQDTTFKHLLALKVLNLANNRIYHISQGSFSDLRSLEGLDLSNNDISWTVEEMNGPFRGLTNLASLRLDGNRITAIAATAFLGLENIKYLNLSANIITSIQENSFQGMDKLQKLWLNTSQLMCDCKIKWFGSWLRSRPSTRHTVHARCLHPQTLYMKSVFNITPDAFVCDTSNPIPQISVHPPSQKAMRGDNVTLRCRVQVVQRNSSSVRLQWRLGYEVISERDITDFVRTDDDDIVTYNSDLFLISVDFSDAGLYQCIASNKYGSQFSKKARLEVLEFPVLTRKPHDVSVHVGGLIKLPCAATGYPVPVISWRMGDGKSKFPAAEEKRIEHLPSEHLFIIRNARGVDTGAYTCTATNGAGSINATAYVTVLEVPRFMQSMVSKRVRTGESAVLECKASGSPMPRFTWYKDDKKVTLSARVVAHGQLLVFVTVLRDDEGTYTCQVSNSLGTARQNTRLTVVEGSELQTCQDKESRYDKKTFLGIIVISVVTCVVGTSLVWLLVIYCARRGSHRRRHKLRARPFQADGTDTTNSKLTHRDELSYIPLKSSSSGSTQTSRDSPRSTATFLASSDSHGAAFPVSASIDTHSGSEKTTGNISSENSLKGSHCSLTSSCPSVESEPVRQVVHVQIHSSDSDSEKCKETSPTRRKETANLACSQSDCEDASEHCGSAAQHCGTNAGYCGIPSNHCGTPLETSGTSSGHYRTFRGLGPEYDSNDVGSVLIKSKEMIVRTPSSEHFSTTHV
ncbi:leucine-rich repeats and immunoglobulin-like domains protein 3 [Nematostella vectensis]|uniref:leucine-rich repeats and immunoglobulin-like domains protein 3 n=1 Tax=Nematostella vectensis TaxID=45351 RepID=UPI0020771B87|nr:leucine-rich repeats and immunoglobulin-like domains protein 3 [Nematostella vectensis]